MISLKKRTISFVLSVCLLLGCFSCLSGIYAGAVVSDWDNVNIENGAVAAKSTVSYNGTVPDGQYLSKVTYNVTAGNLGGSSDRYIKVVYDNDGTYDYYFAYRFNSGKTQVLGCLAKDNGTVAKQDENDCTFTAGTNTTSDTKYGTTPDKGFTSASYDFSDAHTLTMEYTAANEVTFTVADTSGTEISFKLTVKRDGVNFFNSANADKIKITPTVGITLGDINAEFNDIPQDPFADWDGISPAGAVAANSTVSYNAYPNASENQYLQKVKYEINGCPIENTGREIQLIYNIDTANNTYYYFVYRFNNAMTTVYGGLGKNVNGVDVKQDANDSIFTPVSNCSTNTANYLSNTANKQISTAVLAGASSGHTAEIEYTGSSEVKISFYVTPGENEEIGEKVSFIITANQDGIDFKNQYNRFELKPKVQVQIKAIEAVFNDMVTYLTADEYREKYDSLLTLTDDTVNVSDKAAIEAALEEVNIVCTTATRAELSEEISLLNSLLKKIAELQLQQDLNYTTPSVSEGFHTKFEDDDDLMLWSKTSVEEYQQLSTKTGLIPNGGIDFDMEITADPTDSTNRVMKLKGIYGAAIPYSFAVPKHAALSSVTYDVVAMDNASYRFRIIPAYLDGENFTTIEFSFNKTTEQWTSRSNSWQGGTYTRNNAITFEKGIDLLNGFKVSIDYDPSSLKAQVEVIPYDDPDKSEIMTVIYPSPKASFVLPSMLYSYGKRPGDDRAVYYDNLDIEYTEGDWDDDIKIRGPVVYYTGNTLVSPGDTAMITGENLGKTVAGIEIVQLNNTTTQMGYILQNKYDYYATAAEFTAPSSAKEAFEALASQKKSVNIIQRQDESFKFIVPSDFTKGIYAVKILPKYSTEEPVYVYINMPEIDYTVGDEGDIATAGGTVRVIGKYLALDGSEEAITETDDVAACNVKAQLKSSASSAPIECEVTAIQSKYSVTVAIPEGVAAGTYELSIYNGYGDNTCWSAPVKITVGESFKALRPDRIFNVVDYGADPSTLNPNDTPAIVKALEAAALNGGGTVYLPEGFYTFHYTLPIPENVHLKGAGIGKTFLVFSSLHYDYGELPDMEIAVEGNVEISDFNLHSRRCQSNFKSPVACDNIEIHDVFIQNTPLRGSIANGAGGEPLVSEAEARVLLLEEGRSSIKFGFSFRSTGDKSVYYGSLYNNVKIYNNRFEGAKWGAFVSSNSVIHDNIFENGYGSDSSAGHLKILGNSNIFENNGYGEGSANTLAGTLEGNGMYIGGCRLGNTNSNNGEILTNDGGLNYGSDRTGIIKKDESYSDNLHFRFTTGDTYPENRWKGSNIYVQSGQGALQYRTIKYSKDDLIVLDTPFVIEPNRNSRVCIEDGRDNLFIVNCYVQSGAYIGSYGTQVGTVFDGITMTLMKGIKQDTHGGAPNWYGSMVNIHAKNMMQVHIEGEGTDNSTYGGIVFECHGRKNDFFGVTIRSSDFREGGMIYFNSKSAGEISSFIIDNCTFTDEDIAIKYCIPVSKAIKGVLVTRMSFDNVKTPVVGASDTRSEFTADYKVAQETLDSYGYPCLYFYDVSLEYPELYVKGDVNQDGRVTIKDVTLIRYYLVGKIVLSDEMAKRADADGDSEITFADALRIRMFLLGTASLD